MDIESWPAQLSLYLVIVFPHTHGNLLLLGVTGVQMGTWPVSSDQFLHMAFLSFKILWAVIVGIIQLLMFFGINSCLFLYYSMLLRQKLLNAKFYEHFP